MTFRAVLLGLSGAAFISGTCIFNDYVIKQSFLISSYMPIPVFGGLILVVLCVNPLLNRIGNGGALKAPELAVIMCLVLIGCAIPGKGLMHLLPTNIMLPHHFAKTEIGWKEDGLVDQVPERMLADPSGNEEVALEGYVRGLSRGKDDHISLSQIPWSAWTRTLGFWLPLFITLSIAMIALAIVVHHVWADFEQIPYPIVTFAQSLLPEADGGISRIFRSRLFWIGAGAVLSFHSIRFASIYLPIAELTPPRGLDFSPFATLAPTIVSGGGTWLFTPNIFFTVIGLSYFIASDVSFSMGIAPFVYTWCVGMLLGAGVNIGGPMLYVKTESFIYGGAYFAIVLCLLYTGRHFYISVARRSLGLKSADRVEGYVVWSARIFVFAIAAFVVQLTMVHLDWQLAVIYTLLGVMLYVGVSRVVAETGCFFIHPWFAPCTLMWGFLGARALGPESLLIMLVLSSVLFMDPKAALMPFANHGLKLVSQSGIRIGRTGILCGICVLVAITVAVPATLYWQYDRGAKTVSEPFTWGYTTRLPYWHQQRAVQKLKAQGEYKAAVQRSGWQRFTAARPGKPYVIAFLIGLGLVLLCNVARMRFPWWPIHPVMFLVLGTFQAVIFSGSFLIGWIIKVMIVKYGGGELYKRLKPIMIGLIAGEMVAGAIFVLFGFVYYMITGQPPKRFGIF